MLNQDQAQGLQGADDVLASTVNAIAFSASTMVGQPSLAGHVIKRSVPTPLKAAVVASHVLLLAASGSANMGAGCMEAARAIHRGHIVHDHVGNVSLTHAFPGAL